MITSLGSGGEWLRVAVTSKSGNERLLITARKPWVVTLWEGVGR
jgi:hypothetical protein